MRNIRIITNNPRVYEAYPNASEFMDVGAEGVLVAVRDRVHLGAVILNHPLSGGVLPGISPYKSLIVTNVCDTDDLKTDFSSLALIESALKALKKPHSGFEGYDSQALEDFEVLDLDILGSAVVSLKLSY